MTLGARRNGLAPELGEVQKLSILKSGRGIQMSIWPLGLHTELCLAFFGTRTFQHAIDYAETVAACSLILAHLPDTRPLLLDPFTFVPLWASLIGSFCFVIRNLEMHLSRRSLVDRIWYRLPH